MHEQFLLAALEQAKLGQGLCAPNPSVGAVAVQNGNIIAQAWHRGAGTPHAEQLLLAQIPPNTPGVILYSTLEPCNHWGRTPPCVNAIIKHGIGEVCFAYFDPNPLVAENNSSEKLTEQGIKVTYYPLPEIKEFYRSYTHWVITRRPRVTVKIAQSFDGKIGIREGERILLTNSLCEQFTHEMRAISDILLTSAKTIQQDNPKLTVRLNGTEQAKPVAIIDCNLSLNKEATVFSKAKHCFIYHREGLTPSSDHYPNSSFYAIPCKNDRLDLDTIIKHIGGLGYQDVWAEVGGELFTVLHQEALVHRTYIYIAPKSLGENAISAYQQNGLFNREHSIAWQVMGDNVIACLDWQEEECLQEL